MKPRLLGEVSSGYRRTGLTRALSCVSVMLRGHVRARDASAARGPGVAAQPHHQADDHQRDGQRAGDEHLPQEQTSSAQVPGRTPVPGSHSRCQPAASACGPTGPGGAPAGPSPHQAQPEPLRGRQLLPARLRLVLRQPREDREHRVQPGFARAKPFRHRVERPLLRRWQAHSCCPGWPRMNGLLPGPWRTNRGRPKMSSRGSSPGLTARGSGLSP
jgi:hypothetical protein